MNAVPYIHVPVNVLRHQTEAAQKQAETYKGTNFAMLAPYLEDQAWTYLEAIHQQEEAVHRSSSANQTERRRWAVR
jgi:hypothetical protein